MAENTELRERAIQRLKAKSEFYQHLLAYVLTNAALVVIWALTSSTWPFFWPAIPILGWGIGLVFHAYNVFLGNYSEDQIEREMRRLNGPGPRPT